jgi:hypothetical protein
VAGVAAGKRFDREAGKSLMLATARRLNGIAVGASLNRRGLDASRMHQVRCLVPSQE